MKTNIIYFEKLFFKNVFIILSKILSEYQVVLVSGGNSIKRIFNKSSNKETIKKSIKIILSDERIYSNLDDNRTNYYSLKKTLFSKFKFLKLEFIYFSLGKGDKIIAQSSYLKIKDKIPKVAILSLGSDGHICSIFKFSENRRYNKYIDIVNPKRKVKRITINTNYLKKIKKIYFIVNGSQKGHTLNKIIRGKKTNFPLNLSNKITFILDKAAFQKVKKNKNICLKK
tara:strand:- start:1124 stop:1804 length:681 start_codon:yes stop_codon:yes gene_type:complete